VAPWEGTGAMVLKDGLKTLNFSIPAFFFFGWAIILTN